MRGRIKLRIWSPVLNRWKVTYCRPELLQMNVEHLNRAGLQWRIEGGEAGIRIP